MSYKGNRLVKNKYISKLFRNDTRAIEATRAGIDSCCARDAHLL